MPIYTYICTKCKKQFDSLEKIDTNIVQCSCGEQAHKVPSLSNFHLKGQGWGKDGYSKDKK